MSKVELFGWTLTRLLDKARPYKASDGRFVWFSCGSDGNGLKPDRGVLPYDVRRLMLEHEPPMPGNGGVWFSTEDAAMEELEAVLRQIEREVRRESRVHA